MSEEREPYMTLEDARALLAAVEQPEKPQLPLVRTLRDRGLIPVDLFKQLEGEIHRSQGQADAILQHAESGGQLDVDHALTLVVTGLRGGLYSEKALSASIAVLKPYLADHSTPLVRAIELSTNADQLASVASSVIQQCAIPADTEFATRFGITAVRKLSGLAGELGTRKTRALKILLASTTLDTEGLRRLIDESLKCGPLRAFDIAQQPQLKSITAKKPILHAVLVARANTEADLNAAAELFLSVDAVADHATVMHNLLKRYAEDVKPSVQAVKAISGALNPLVVQHEEKPETGAASHDAALLLRWAKEHPSIQALQAAANRIEAARKEYKPAVQLEAKEKERLESAIRFIRDEIVPGGLKIIAVGGKKSAAADAAFDEFGKSPPQWGEWITKEYNQALNSYQIQENIQSPKCIAVLIITKPASHALTNQAKEAAEKAGRPVVWIEEATKKKIREGMKALVEKIAAGAHKTKVRQDASQ